MTIKDIAEKAGVSMITVSRVINTPEKLSPKAREKIEKILKENGYTHNTAAHNLASNKSGIICIYASKDLPYLDPFFQQFLVGVGSYLSNANYSFQIINEVKPTQFCDGYILSGFNYSDHILDDAKKTGKPVAMFSSFRDSEVDIIDTDNKKSSKKIISYLLSRGHRKIAIVLNRVNGVYVSERFEGYKEALKENNISFNENYVFTVDNSIEGGINASRLFIEQNCDATAVFLITDMLATGFVIGMKSFGHKVPDDISVVGFDGLGHHLMSSPKITTMAQPVYQIAQELSKCLLDRIKNPKLKPTYKLVEGLLDEEESTKVI